MININNYEGFVDMQAIIFDLDGVLVDSRSLHFDALNWALSKVDPSYIISLEEHLAKYDGRPTKAKLEMLTKEKGLDPARYNQVWRWKQEHTLSLIKDTVKTNEQLRAMLLHFKEKGLKIFCASNSIRATLEDMLVYLGIRDIFDGVYSNEDVIHTKPHPHIYIQCFADHGLVPQRCLIVEDSPIGRMAAELSGAHVCVVTGPSQVTLEHIEGALEAAVSKNRGRKIDTRWPSEVQVVIPMAGEGSRFVMAGFDTPKPLIDVRGKAMIEWVVENLALSSATFIFVVRKSHLENACWQLRERLEKHVPGCKIVVTDGLTEGPACTVLLAEPELDRSKPILIANSDQFLEWDVNAFLYESQNVDGCISVFHQPDATDTKWSYARLDSHGFVKEVKEKEPISDIATTGIYYWSRAGDFIDCAKSMIAKNIRVNNEFYVCPVYNEAVEQGLKIKVSYCKKMWGLGVPADLEHFLMHYP